MRLFRRFSLTFQYVSILTVSLFCLTGFAAAQSGPPAATSAADRGNAPFEQDPVESPSGAGSAPSMEAGERSISTKQLFPNILHDQKPIWLFPVHVFEGKHLKPTLALAAATATLIVLDPYDEPYFRNNPGFKTYKTGPLRGRNGTLGITMLPLAMYLGGLASKDQHAENTGLLAAEAIADTQIVSLVLKAVDGRLHPSDIPPGGNFRDTWFKYRGTWNNPGSFPSGHSTSAFAVAAVFSDRYRDHRWVPWVAYGLASVFSLSRIPDQAHFPSDVFAGAALGYAISHYVVLGHGNHDASGRR
jgi:PAP2 superfamily protein